MVWPASTFGVHRPGVAAPAGRRFGFTAFETLIAIAILAFVTATLSGALSAGRQQTANARNTVSATLLAQSLMDEILRLPYTDPLGYTTLGPDPGETTRQQYLCIENYSGYTDGPTNITDIANNPYPASMQGFVRAVTVTNTSVQPTGWALASVGQMVQVTVSYGGTQMVVLQRFVPQH